jgi:hypothetical protein
MNSGKGSNTRNTSDYPLNKTEFHSGAPPLLSVLEITVVAATIAVGVVGALIKVVGLGKILNLTHLTRVAPIHTGDASVFLNFVENAPEFIAHTEPFQNGGDAEAFFNEVEIDVISGHASDVELTFEDNADGLLKELRHIASL